MKYKSKPPNDSSHLLPKEESGEIVYPGKCCGMLLNRASSNPFSFPLPLQVLCCHVLSSSWKDKEGSQSFHCIVWMEYLRRSFLPSCMCHWWVVTDILGYKPIDAQLSSFHQSWRGWCPDSSQACPSGREFEMKTSWQKLIPDKMEEMLLWRGSLEMI